MFNGSSAVVLHNRTSRHMVYAANHYNGYMSDRSFHGPSPLVRIPMQILHGPAAPARIPLPIQQINPPLAVIHPVLISKPTPYYQIYRKKRNVYVLCVKNLLLIISDYIMHS